MAFIDEKDIPPGKVPVRWEPDPATGQRRVAELKDAPVCETKAVPLVFHPQRLRDRPDHELYKIPVFYWRAFKDEIEVRPPTPNLFTRQHHEAALDIINRHGCRRVANPGCHEDDSPIAGAREQRDSPPILILVQLALFAGLLEEIEAEGGRFYSQDPNVQLPA